MKRVSALGELDEHGLDLVRIATGAGIIFFGIVFGRGVSYFYQIFVARFLGAESFGLYSLGMIIFNIGMLVSCAGMQNGALRFVAMYQGVKDRARVKGTILFSVVSVMLVGVFFGGLLFLLSDWIGVTILHKERLPSVLKVFALGVPFAAVLTVLVSIIKGFQSMRYFVYVKNFFEPWATFLFALVFIFSGFRLMGVVGAWVAGIAASIGLGWFYLQKLFPVTDRTTKAVYPKRELILFSLPLLPVGLFHIGMIRMDALILGFFKTSHEVGVYSAALQTSMVTLIILDSFNTIFTPMISDLYNKGENQKLEGLFKTVTKWTFTLTLPVFLVVCLLSANVLSLFGQEFKAGALCLIILCFGQLIRGAGGAAEYVLIMSGRTVLTLVNIIIGFLALVLLNVLLVPTYGMMGAAIASACSVIIIVVLRLSQILYLMKIHPYKRDCWKPVLAGLISFAIVYTVKGQFLSMVSYPLAAILLWSVTFGLIYVALLFAFGFEKEDRFILEWTRGRVLKKYSTGDSWS